MNRKLVNGFAMGFLVGLPVFADDAAGLQSQVEAVTRRLDALEKAGGAAPGDKKGAWAEKTKVDGYVRIRYDHDTVDGKTTENRMRFRALAGVSGNATDELYGGIRVASGSDDRATSNNQNFTGYASEKRAWIDLAYIGYAPRYAEGLDLSIGKIEKPWIDLDSMYWDGDVNPEGASLAYRRDAGPVNLFTHGGYFIMDEGGNDDTSLSSAQLAAKGNLRENIALRLGGTAFLWDNIDGAQAPGNRTNGNSYENVPANGATNRHYATGFRIGHLFADLAFKTKHAEFKLLGETSRNFAADDGRDRAWLAGFSAKYAKISAKYNFRDMDEDSTVAFFSDSDFAASNIAKGHKISAKYDFTKNFHLGFTYNLGTRWDEKKQASIGHDTFYFDGVIKF